MNAFLIVAGILLLAVLPIDATRMALAATAATLFESLPFILAGTLLAGVASRWGSRLMPFFGCGCGEGPSARSLPAAAITWIVFGPTMALARLGAAIVVAACVDRLRAIRVTTQTHSTFADSFLTQLLALLPFAVGGASLMQIAATWFDFAQLSGVGGMFVGAIFGFGLSPCALGAVAIGASLRHGAPAAAFGFLSIAGIADLRALRSSHHHALAHDGIAYGLGALGCALVAFQHGDALINPRFTLALWVCAAAMAWCAWRFRNERHAALRWAPVLMVLGSIVAAPAPQYHATETSLSSAFAGESLDFTGVLTRTGNASTLVRYAITCCRADASPIVIRLTHQVRQPAGWIHAHGTFVRVENNLQLAVDRWTPIAAPTDPFIYR
ncbi:MAG: hypothetical protein M3Y21_07455 [Candidatus Eremiobacteraeota bacterium]|nr:hypothetical protein [Candidatus Eremiobacteraeota bacterium]